MKQLESKKRRKKRRTNAHEADYELIIEKKVEYLKLITLPDQANRLPRRSSDQTARRINQNADRRQQRRRQNGNGFLAMFYLN